jgi:hypothetical protein
MSPPAHLTGEEEPRHPGPERGVEDQGRQRDCGGPVHLGGSHPLEQAESRRYQHDSDKQGEPTPGATPSRWADRPNPPVHAGERPGVAGRAHEHDQDADHPEGGARTGVHRYRLLQRGPRRRGNLEAVGNDVRQGPVAGQDRGQHDDDREDAREGLRGQGHPPIEGFEVDDCTRHRRRHPDHGSGSTLLCRVTEGCRTA